MKSAADALKNAHKGMDVDNVHDMMDDIAEQQDVAKEISEAISNPVAFGQGKDFCIFKQKQSCLCFSKFVMF
jgi:charged multivesicular body protein 4